ncbi:MAG: putative DNA binding domain-containing protein [Chloroflexi bacterium]|nr:putative DNA binding domain-containing protein [Chloroflexota bacterium]
MSDSRQERRLAILANPTETLKIECKSWLDLNASRHKAVIAKAAIALANTEGGTIVFGVSKEDPAGSRLTCKPKPPELLRYTSDTIASAINKYADPDINFNLEFENHPETGEEHAFVEIAGGMQQPVFAKKTFDGVINKLACYIRKPGPKSEKPHSVQEWRDLMTRCVRANRESMLDSIRTIMDGRPLDTVPAQSDEEQLREFMNASEARWQERLDEVEEDDVARLRNGYWVFAFSIVGASPWPTLNDLRRTLEEERPADLRHRLFANVGGQGRSPYAARGAIEAWTGNPEANIDRRPYSCSFWRTTLSGEFYHLEGFFEDDYPNRTEPGTVLYLDLSLQLHAMMLMLAARIARSVGEETEIVICSEMTGLNGRYLTGSQAWWSPLDGWLSSLDAVALQPRRLTPQQIDDNSVEVLYDFLYPLYEKFGFYELKQEWVESAVEAVKSDGW